MTGEKIKNLRDLANRALNAAEDERPALFVDLSEAISQPDIECADIRNLCKMLVTTLTKFKDEHSQKLVRNLLVDMINHHHDAATEGLMTVFKVLALKELANAPPNKASKAALISLGWSFLLNKYCNRESNVFKDELPRLVDYQSHLYQIVLLASCNNLKRAADTIMFEILCEEDYYGFYKTHLMKKDPSSQSLLMLLSLLNNKNDIATYKEDLINIFIKAVITAKKKPFSSIIPHCGPLLNIISKNDFETMLLPPMQRAILRNPEIVVQAVGVIIKELSFDFSLYALPLVKVIMPNLCSKDELTRKEAAETVNMCSSKCTSADVIAEILKLLFETLNGSGGKVTVAEIRINILECAGNLQNNNVAPDDLQKLFPIVIELFSKILISEVHEKVLCKSLESFGTWSTIFTENFNATICEIAKKGLQLKSTTQTVRLSYLQWLLTTMNGKSFQLDESFITTLLKFFDQGLLNSSQISLVSEAACVACIFLKTTGAENNASLISFWNSILDLNKSIFFTERLIASSSPDIACCITLIAHRLLTVHYKNIKGNCNILFRIIVLSILSTSKKVRDYSKKLIHQLISHEQCIAFVNQVFEELKDQLTTNEKTFEEHDSHVLGKSLSETIQLLCNLPNISRTDSECLAFQLILICHHPLIMNVEPLLWESLITQQFKIDLQEFMTSKHADIFENVVLNFKATPVYENAIATLARVSSDTFLPLLIANVTNVLNDPSIINVTDDEYFTFLTPDGELYDKSVIPNTDDLYSTTGLKRENKAYSYKEQIEELQLRREIEEKKRKDGKAKPIKLTPKQEEVIRNQTEKEQQIKNRLRELNNKLLNAVKMLEATFIGNINNITLHFPKLLSSILLAMKSPLAAERLVKLYFNFHNICFANSSLGKQLAINTIRLQKPHCDLNNDWLAINIDDAVICAITELKTHTLDSGNTLMSPAFTYAFEFLRRALFCTCISSNEELLLCGIKIIELHAQMRGKTIHGALSDFCHPRYLPSYEMFQLLLTIVRIYSGRVQNQAVVALLEVAKCNSGEDYCSIANKEEIKLLLCALEDSMETVREAALRSLLVLQKAIENGFVNDNELMITFQNINWISTFDVFPENRSLATDLWEKLNLNVPDYDQILPYVIHDDISLQKAAADSLVPLLKSNPSLAKCVLKKLLKIYSEKLEKIPPKLDKFDREIEPAIDQWRSRRGVAIAISKIAKYFSIEDVNHVMQFMVAAGLGDRDEVVHKEMLAAALTIVDIHGRETIVNLLPVFEEFLDKAPKSESFDNIRQAVVILMGSLARHLEKDDPRIEPIVRRLLTALSTPSQQVQEAVSNCLPHLMPSVKDEAASMIKRLLHSLVKSEKYGERRGAAYGIAGIVKGLGILSLKQFDIMAKLTTYIQEKKNYKSREGALFAFEILCTTLGRLFEPYIVHVLPHLLQCFGDSSQYVRQAADDTAKVVMAKLSAHGVKLVLPSLLEALDEDSWRTKTASVELLGAMAFCAPKQLSSCLPAIVPKLIEVLGDSHTKVQQAGADALKVIGSVIKNPEIQAIVPVLLKALEDPSRNTSTCLQNLLQTKFVHFIDAPSLALIMPVVQRAFLDRSTETRKMSAQIIGNMYSLTDQKDLTPYLPNIIPGLKMSLLDPVPEVRAVSARALGAMVRGMGESSFEDLLPWLMQTLTSESSSVDRSGAAQGLSEVVGGLGVEKLHKLMPEIIATAERNDIAPHVKDGYIMMFIYMPNTFPQDFTPYIGQIINPILKALADENEYVRDTALKAGQRIVNLYAETAVTLLLPELEKGLFDDNWRIRFSSVQLLGDLLYRISGVSGKMTTETASEDDNFGTEQSHAAIIRYLGNERRNRVLSGLYMGRSDVSLMVRQAALHVWKVVVTNTPRTLREILPTLFGLLLGCLASTSYDKRQVAARTLGDLVRKLGERVLPEIIPILESGLNSEHADQRQGVCIGLSEIMESTSKEMVLSFVNSLVPTVRKALSDPLPEVRIAAARTFDSLHSTVGSKALDDILPSMMEGLSDPDPERAENTLDGLRQVMSIKSRVVLPYLVPQLTSPPVNTKALSILVSVAGDALTKYLPKILHALLQALSEAQGTSNEMQELEYCQTVVLSVTDDVGIRTIMDTLMSSAKSEVSSTRKSSVSLLSAFCIHSPGNYTQYVPQLLRCLLRLLAENDRDILQYSWEALNAVVKGLDSSQQIAHVSDVRQAVRFAASDSKEAELPGFCLPKGITPLLPVFREAILNGLPEEKENAAQGLGEIIVLTSAQSLQPSVVHITGPLIRILGDRFNAGVKAAVLETLAILLHKVGVMLKQFLPQLQTTFLKALHDQNRLVRMKAGYALSELVVIHTRADPIFNEIHNSLKLSDDSATRETMLHALRNIITPAGNKMSDSLKKQVITTLICLLGHQEDVTRGAAGGCLGVLLKYLPSNEVNDLICNYMLLDDGDLAFNHGRTVFLFVGLKECAEIILNSGHEEQLLASVISHISSDKIPIASNGIRAATYIIKYKIENQKSLPTQVVWSFSRAMNHTSNEIKQLVAKCCNYIATSSQVDELPTELMKSLIPMLVNGTKEKNGYVKSNSEIALVSILHLRKGETVYDHVCQVLDPGARDSLSEVVSKVLRKVAVQPPGKDEELDDTILV
ncbi:stalled ribosome sensor GCN1 [Musca vetustissima]|uniref:stalled ribosome sensor GCN1 n=1 Tax=Musca vetustissima TaxID=27455 RepID=UPI002AB62D35|nr:stalled ribosome sensor GCN1 [Musca vetustissima]